MALTDQERIIVLRRAGLGNGTIAAILDIDTADVNDALAGDGSLPEGGGGGGLVIGAWEELDTGAVVGFPVDSTPYPLPAVGVPTEILLVYVPEPNTSGGFFVANPDDDSAFEESVTNWADTTHAVYVKTMIPADTDAEIRPIFGGSAWTVQNIRRRTLG